MQSLLGYFWVVVVMFMSGQVIDAKVLPKRVRSANATQMLAEIKKNFLVLKSFSAQLIQEQDSSLFVGEKQVSEGVIFFKKPHFLRWEMKVGNPFILVTQANQASYYTPGATPDTPGQLVKSKTSPMQLRLIISLFSGAFDPKFFHSPAVMHAHKIQWKPTAQVQKWLSDLTTITLELDPKTKMASVITLGYQGPVGAYQTIVRLRNIRRNVKLEQRMFEFAPPPNTQMIQDAQG